MTTDLRRQRDREGRRPTSPLDAWARLGTRRRRMVLYVALHRARRGCGPTWRELGKAVGSHSRSFDWVLVKSCGPTLTYRVDEPRSLDVARELAPILSSILAGAAVAPSSSKGASPDAR